MSKYERGEYKHREAGMVTPYQPIGPVATGFRTPAAEVSTLPVTECYTTADAEWLVENHQPRHQEITAVPERGNTWYWSYYFKASLHAVVTINEIVKEYLEQKGVK